MYILGAHVRCGLGSFFFFLFNLPWSTQHYCKRRLVCLKQETTYVAGWIGTFHFSIRTDIRTTSTHPPHPPMESYPWKFLLSAPFKIASEGSNWNVVGVLKTDRARDRLLLLLLIGGGGRGGGVEKWNARFCFQPPHFLLRSARARKILESCF